MTNKCKQKITSTIYFDSVADGDKNERVTNSPLIRIKITFPATRTGISFFRKYIRNRTIRFIIQVSKKFILHRTVQHLFLYVNILLISAGTFMKKEGVSLPEVPLCTLDLSRIVWPCFVLVEVVYTIAYN